MAMNTQPSTATVTKTKTKTKTIVGIALASAAIAAAAAGAAGIGRSIPSVSFETAKVPTSQELVKGTEDAKLYGIKIGAVRRFDIEVTDLIFTVIGEDDARFSTIENDVQAQDHFTSCELLEGGTDVVIAGPEAIDSNGQLAFGSLNYLIEGKDIQKFVVRCDLANTDLQNNDPDAFAFTIAGRSDILVNNAKTGDAILDKKKQSGDPGKGSNNNGSIVSTEIVDVGKLAIVSSLAMPDSDILLGQQTQELIAKYDFVADGEDMLVETLMFQNCLTQPGDETSKCTGSSSVGDYTAGKELTIQYENEQGNTNTHSAFFSVKTIPFYGLKLFVPDGEKREVNVYVDTNSVGAAGADSGAEFQINLAADANARVEFEAHGMTSGSTLDADDLATYAIANPMTLRANKPIISLDSSSPSGISVPGDQEILRATVVGAKPGVSGQINNMTLKLSTIDNSGSGWATCGELADVTKWNFKLDYSGTFGIMPVILNFYDANGDICGSANSSNPLTYITSTTTLNYSSGIPETFAIWVDTTNASSDDVIRLDIAEESEYDNFSYLQSIGWEDDDPSQNIDGTHIKNLPVRGGTIVF